MRLAPRIVATGVALTLYLQAVGGTPAEDGRITPTDRSGLWRTNVGDDPSFAAPTFNDSAWREVPLKSTWTEQGYDGYDGVVWYRRTVPLEAPRLTASGSRTPGVLLGPTRYGSYELYAGGRMIGWYGSEWLPQPAPAWRAYAIPPGTLDADGRVTLALRVRRVGWASDRAAQVGEVAGPVESGVRLGDYGSMRDRATLARQRELNAGVPQLMFAMFFGLVGLASLHSHWRGRGRPERLWFGLFALLLSVNAFLVSSWVFELTSDVGLVRRLIAVVIHLAVAVSIQFLWPMLSQRIGRLLRAYQWAHVLIACVIAAALSPELIAATKAARWVSFLPLLLAAPVLIVRRVLAGDREARTLALGVVLLVASELHEMAVQVFHIAPLTSIPLPSIGFVCVILAMAVSVSSRQRREHEELVELRGDLQRQVKRRTVELSSVNERLVSEIAERKEVEAALRDSETRFRHIAEKIEDVFWLTDWIGRKLLYVSPAYETIWGRPRRELYDDMRSWARSIHPEDKEYVLKVADSGAERGRSDIEYRIIRDDGEIRWIHERAFPFCDESGQVYRIAGISRDITRQKRAEEARRAAEEERNQSEVFLEEAQRAARMGFWDWSIRTDELYWSDEVYRIFGVEPTASTVTDEIFTRAVHPDDRSAVQARVDAALNQGADYVVEYRIVLPDGEERHIHEQGEVIRDDNGSPVRMLGTVIDLTERKRAEEAARDLTRILDTYFKSTLTCLVLLDRDFNFLRVNQAYARVCGRDVSDFPGRNHFDMYPSEAETIFTEVVRTRRAYAAEARPFVFPDRPEEGITYWNWTLVPILDDVGEVELLVFSLVDVTEKKKLEEELRHAHKLEAVGTLASGVAHDFNNVLTAIVGYNEVARQIVRDNPDAAEALEGISKAAEQAAAVTRSLLAFSRKSTSLKVPLDFRRIVGGSIRLLRRMMPAAIDIKPKIEHDGRLWIEGDETQIQQVIMNLAINARDAMADGGQLTISLQYRPGEPYGEGADEHGAAVLTVVDTGAGMSKAVADRVFEPFFTTKSRERGTGLGMAVVHGIISDHLGHIRVDSIEGRGTLVTVTLPCCDPVDPRRPTDPVVCGGYTGRGETILVSEDNRHVRDVVSRALEKGGFRVATTSDGEEAMETFYARGDELALVILDVDLPKKAGIACLDEMRRSRHDLPAVIITGSAGFVLPENLADHTKVLRKPFQMSTLSSVVRDSLRVPQSQS